MIGYFDLPSGLSGDMFLGCLVDAGWQIQNLRDTIRKLGLPESEWSLEARAVMKGASRATLVEVQVKPTERARHLSDVKKIIESGDLPPVVARRAVNVFVRLAEAEAKVHGTTPEKIHFHEVGGLDAIIDVVGAVAGINELGIETLYASEVPLGEGWVETMHGRIPLPAPATLELLAAQCAPTRPAPGPGEWVTPTGAALLAELATFRQPAMTISRIGMGAGQRDAPWPNVARLWIGAPSGDGPVVQIETNIDDMNPQFFAAVTDSLFEAGALDVWLTPVQMKKGRPAVVLAVLSPAPLENKLADLMLRETTTLGVRVTPVHRHEARRENRRVETGFGPVEVKLKWIGDQLVGAMPEYDQCVKLARTAKVPVNQVHDAALAAGRNVLDDP